MGCGGAVDGYASGTVGIGNGLLNLADAAAKTAAFVGAERNYLLAGKVVALQESEHSHGRKAPPVGIAKDDGVVLLHVLHPGGEFRTGLGPEFVFGLLDADHIVRRILLHGIYLENIGIRKLCLDLLYDNLIIAFCKVSDAAANIILPAAGVKSDKCLSHSRNQLTDAKFGDLAGLPVIDFSRKIIEFSKYRRDQIDLLRSWYYCQNLPPTVTFSVAAGEVAFLGQTGSERLYGPGRAMNLLCQLLLSSLGIRFKETQDSKFLQSAIQSAIFAL